MPAEPFRRAGHGRLADGRAVAWSVAEGRHGRRWRWTLTGADGMLGHAGLIELDPGGGFARLELETAGGMVTLHPAPDGRSAHGNIVGPRGVTPVVIQWAPDTAVGIEGDPFGSALLAAGQGSIIRITAESQVVVASHRDGATGGALALDAHGVLALDARGVPVLHDAQEWPLEV